LALGEARAKVFHIWADCSKGNSWARLAIQENGLDSRRLQRLDSLPSGHLG